MHSGAYWYICMLLSQIFCYEKFFQDVPRVIACANGVCSDNADRCPYYNFISNEFKGCY